MDDSESGSPAAERARRTGAGTTEVCKVGAAVERGNIFAERQQLREQLAVLWPADFRSETEATRWCEYPAAILTPSLVGFCTSFS